MDREKIMNSKTGRGSQERGGGKGLVALQSPRNGDRVQIVTRSCIPESESDSRSVVSDSL